MNYTLAYDLKQNAIVVGWPWYSSHAFALTSEKDVERLAHALHAFEFTLAAGVASMEALRRAVEEAITPIPRAESRRPVIFSRDGVIVRKLDERGKEALPPLAKLDIASFIKRRLEDG